MLSLSDSSNSVPNLFKNIFSCSLWKHNKKSFFCCSALKYCSAIASITSYNTATYICVFLCVKCKLTSDIGGHRVCIFLIRHWTQQSLGPLRGSGFLLRSLVNPAQLHFLLMETKPQIANSVWSQLSPNLRPVPPLIMSNQTSLPTLPESIHPSRAAFTCEGLKDPGQEIPHFTLIKFFFQNPHGWLSSDKSRVPMFDPPLHWCNQWKEGSNAPHNKETKIPQ